MLIGSLIATPTCLASRQRPQGTDRQRIYAQGRSLAKLRPWRSSELPRLPSAAAFPGTKVSVVYAKPKRCGFELGTTLATDDNPSTPLGRANFVAKL